MAATIAPAALKSLLTGKEPFALIDVREAGEYNSSHIPGASLIARRQLELQAPQAMPFKGTPIVVCDDDGRRARLAAGTLERMGYRQVSVLDGGINRWVTDGFETEWGMNVPSKDFGEKVEVVHHVPEVECKDLAARIQKGEKFVILDSRTPEEFRRFCIPGGRSVPGGELALRITDIARDIDKDTTIIVNCAGRTRSIIGARVLQRMGIPRVYGLKNGTSGWVLAGHRLETGADRVQLPEPSAAGVAAAEAYAAKLAAEDGVRYLDIPALKSVIARRDQATIYLIDVRTAEEYSAGHIPGFRWFPGGQAVQPCADGRGSALAAATLGELSYQSVSILEGGMAAWQNAGLPVDKGLAGVMAPPTDVVPAGPDRNFADMQNYLRWEEALGHKYAPSQPLA